ncbi:MAG TPA: DUF4112 domain-containing protein [Terriglobales bacterium]|nr:DUF4112 domain-containing protein [Terriglobales bacterium]
MIPSSKRPPSRAPERLPAWADRLVRFLDDGWVVPGTRFRIGFDALIGLIPGVGDVFTTASSLSLVWLAYERRVPRTVMARILFNVGLDAVAGAIPVLGDIFDVVYKANRRNLTLLERHAEAPQATTAASAGLLVLILLVGLVLLAIPIALALLLVRLIAG